MHEDRQPVRYLFEGLLPGDRDLPSEVLYDVHLAFAHGAKDEAAERLAEGLAYLGGDVRVRRLPMVGTRVRSHGGKVDLDARVRNGRVELEAGHRLKGKALARLVDAIAAGLPNAHDLELRATSPHFSEPYSEVKPCSPCMARNFPVTR